MAVAGALDPLQTGLTAGLCFAYCIKFGRSPLPTPGGSMSLLSVRIPPLLRRLVPVLLAASLMAAAIPASAQPAKPLVKVRYEEVIRSVLYVPMYVALNQGYFKDAGLDVGMKTSQGTDKGMAALLSG